MKRPLLAVGISFALGTWASFFMPFSPLMLSAALCSAGCVAALIRRDVILLPVVLLSAAAAVGCGGFWASRNLAPLEAAAASGAEATVMGVITEAEHSNPGYTLIVDVRFAGSGLPDTTLRLRGYEELEYAAGDSVLCAVRLQPLTGSLNYYNSRGIFVGGRIVSIEPFGALNLSEAVGRSVARLRAGMLRNLADSLPADVAAVESGMVLGDRASLDSEVSDALARAGTIHLLSVSGMHLSIIIGCLTRFLERLGLGKRPRALIGMLSAVGFAALTGFLPSMTRALIMMLIVLSADLFSRRGDSLNSLGFALLLISIARPYWLLSSGLWLSASSTAGIAVLYRPLWRKISERYRGEGRAVRYLARLLLGAGAVSLSAYAFSFPILLATAGWVPLVSPIANVLIAPLTVPALLCGMVCAVFPAAATGPFATAATACIRLIVSISQIMAEIPIAFSLDELWRVVFLLAAAAVAALLYRWKAEKSLWRYGAVTLAIVFAAGNSIHMLAARNQVELVAIGGCSPTVLLRGDSAVVVGTPSVYEIGRLLRYLSYREVRRVDAVIAHDCPEQVGSGLIRLTKRYPPGLVIGPDDDYILAELSRALPGLEVVSSGYAAIAALDGVTLAVSLAGNEVEIVVGRVKAVKTGAEYAIMEGTAAPGGLRIWDGGALVWTKQTPPSFEPVGDMIFGERRIVLDC